jgi:hypothetical protein
MCLLLGLGLRVYARVGLALVLVFRYVLLGGERLGMVDDAFYRRGLTLCSGALRAVGWRAGETIVGCLSSSEGWEGMMDLSLAGKIWVKELYEASFTFLTLRN